VKKIVGSFTIQIFCEPSTNVAQPMHLAKPGEQLGEQSGYNYVVGKG